MIDATWRPRTVVSEASLSLARELSLAEPLARLLIARGVLQISDAQLFLQPTLRALHDPLLMLGMERAVVRLRSALAAGEPILIYGDYDVDGTVATVLLKTAAERVAAAFGQKPDVRYHIPHRIREGYGMQGSRIVEAATEGVRLVVSVDTGIRGFAAAEEARRVGLDLIVTDHHLPDEIGGIPDALAVVNPNQPGCPYPYKELCGAAVAFKLAQALLESVAADDAERTKLRAKVIPSFLKLLAIATIADAVPLTGENRIIAALGLAELRHPSQHGLRSLMELAEIEFGPGVERPISAMDVGFRLAPRINAAGRMDAANDVVEMFLTRDPELARTLATKLHRLNDDRRASEAEALREIDTYLEGLREAQGDWPACLVLDDGWDGKAQESGEETTRWHRGVIGILASRVVERTGRPALVLAHEADGLAYGSGRSVAGFHLLDALTAVHGETGGGLLARFGGHAHAVGFALSSERVGRLREGMQGYAAEHSPDPGAAEVVQYDGDLSLAEVTPEFLAALERLAPFGNGNEEPVWRSAGVRLAAPPRTVAQKHLRLRVEDPDTGVAFTGVAWTRRTNWAELAADEGWQQGDAMDLLYRLHRNWKPGFAGWELEIVAARRADAGSRT
ncbi:exonuclease RecJ [Bryocella elongata]|uniref:Single-stranded-DNA-specific exonuclease RecJ n=1 Tax=Bryocella elongata TaxID=863522 RepID=A0A1H5TPK2_9BACT|nr:single-stranded-DNA-specific exonuclease RecJ [Bryocella elongata]SEF64689.1 exonuclease RecJ [Bryocella elongata]